MRIAIDARAFSWTGVGRYIRNLLTELASVSSTHEYIVLIGDKDREQFAQFKNKMLNGRFTQHTVTSDYYSVKEQTVFLQQLLLTEADLFHFTHFNVPIGFTRPYVVTIHDITRFIYPGQQRQSLFQQIAYEYTFLKAVTHARTIICVCNTTREELMQLPLYISAPIQVIHEGVDTTFTQTVVDKQRESVRTLLKYSGMYLLYVGVWMNHKNLDRLLLAFKEVLRESPQLKLVITGDMASGYVDIQQSVNQYGLSQNVILPGFVPHQLLPALYAEATCFVYPSLYEGFGLPPLEAAACGTPVVTSLASTMPEIMGDGAMYVNPESIQDIARGISHVIHNEHVRKRLRAAGLERVKAFSWKACAKATAEIYHQSLQNT